VFGVDGAGWFSPALAEVHHGLDLAGNVVRRSGGHLRFFHQLQQVGLHPAPADIPPLYIRGGSNLVDFIDVYDAVLRAGDVAIGQSYQVTDHVLDIPADVAGFRELGRVSFDERDADQVGGAPDQESLADAGGADEHDVLLGIIGGFLSFQGQTDVVVMIAQGHAEHLFGFVLLDNEPIEVLFDLARFVIEFELVAFAG